MAKSDQIKLHRTTLEGSIYDQIIIDSANSPVSESYYHHYYYYYIDIQYTEMHISYKMQLAQGGGVPPLAAGPIKIPMGIRVNSWTIGRLVII